MTDHPDLCGRCGHRKDEHVSVTTLGASPILICPVAIFLPDTLPTLLIESDEPKKTS